MPDPIMYEDSENYVVLEPDQPEQFLTAPELLEKLKSVLASMPERLPRDAQRFSELEQQARYVMETSCELDVGPDQFLQWYAVRLEK
jgi:hypothetical protein